MKRLLVFVALLALFACRSHQGSRSESPGIWEVEDKRPCAGGCESNMWPRLILGVQAPAALEGDPANLVRATIRDETGAVFAGNLHGCPAISDIVCSYSFFTNPRDHRVTLIVEPAAVGEPSAESVIPLGRFNTCGREITYVIVTLAAGSSPRFGAPRWLSPCERGDGR